jgi:hypothetical protein
VGGGLGGHIDHMGLALRVKMGQTGIRSHRYTFLYKQMAS